MEWIWIILGALILTACIIICIVMASGKIHPPTPDEDNDQMEAIRKYNEKRALRDAKRQARATNQT